MAGQAHEKSLVAGPGDLEEDPALLQQAYLPVVEGPRDAGQAEVLDQLAVADPPMLVGPDR